jgi:hypothetical protein
MRSAIAVALLGAIVGSALAGGILISRAQTPGGRVMGFNSEQNLPQPDVS